MSSVLCQSQITRIAKQLKTRLQSRRIPAFPRARRHLRITQGSPRPPAHDHRHSYYIRRSARLLANDGSLRRLGHVQLQHICAFIERSLELVVALRRSRQHPGRSRGHRDAADATADHVPGRTSALCRGRVRRLHAGRRSRQPHHHPGPPPLQQGQNPAHLHLTSFIDCATRSITHSSRFHQSVIN